MADTLGSTLGTYDGRSAPRRGSGPAPRPFLFLGLECDRPIAGGCRYAIGGVDAVLLGRGAVRGSERNDSGVVRELLIQVPDRWISGRHARMVRVLGRWVIEDLGSRNGTLVNGRTETRAVLADGDIVELGHTLFVFRETLAVTEEGPTCIDGAELQAAAPGLATLLPTLHDQMSALPQVARSEVPIMLHGESGTGKEVIARAVHTLSGRTGAFVAVNCGALPDTLIESELFGYKRGAFSGASEDRPGLVRAAHEGTLFLDEIGDLPAASQAAFLRVLQEREVMPVGATRPVPVDFRLVAATHRDLAKLVAEEKFRPDLYARLTGYSMVLPPLRDRREDLGLLVATLLPRAAGERGEKLCVAPEAARAIFNYDWPLNIRELEKCLATAAVLATDGFIDLAHLPEAMRRPPEQGDDSQPGVPSAEPRKSAPVPKVLSPEDETRKAELVRLLVENQGNISQVARIMGKARMQIQRWVKRYGIDPESFRE